jgi:hypothetical protein
VSKKQINFLVLKMAQEGHQILWGLKGRTYILCVLDGKSTLLKKN